MKTRILAIAPYQGMKEIMNEIKANRDDIELTVHIGNLENGLKIVQSCDLDDFDIIVSRGGTAKMIASHVPTPVVEVEITVYDILRAIKLAESYTKRFAIIGYPAVTDCAKILCDLMKYNIDIITLDDGIDVYDSMKNLRTQGYEMVLCDMIGTSVAYEVGLNSILVTSGKESIEAAFDQAIKSSRLFSHYREQSIILKNAVIQGRESLFVYTREGKLVFSSLERSSVTEPFFQQVEKNLSSFLADPRFRMEERMDSFILSLYSRHTTIHGCPYVYIYLYIQDAPVLVEDIGVSFYEKKENLYSDTSDLYGSANFVGDTRNALEQYSSTLYPILILGEDGTGKDKAASFLYEHSEYKKHPFYIIDCTQTNQKKWTYLMESANSPLNNLHTTIYIKNLQALEETLAIRFLSYLKQSDFHKRNRFIFSFTINRPEDESCSSCQYLMNTLSCLVLRLLPLRERVNDIPSIAALYINQVNIELGKQVVGFDDDALALIRNFSWKQNLAQFKRVIRQLIVQTDGYYITADLVQQILKQESPKVSSSLPDGYEIINTNQSLDDINYDIVRMILEQEGMNKTKAVERLKISRSTLWRMLRQ